MPKFPEIKINDYYSVKLDEMGKVSLHKVNQAVVGSMSYYYTRNDLPLFICRHYPGADLQLIHKVMQQLDEQMAKMVECGCLKVGGQNVAICQNGAV